MKLFEANYFLIFLSLTATSLAFQYAKPGCSDMCGNVRIPYPFGIGSTCSVNEWYTVDCNSSTPYLPALNYLEIMNVDWENQTVTINTPMISDCRNPVQNTSQTKSVDLGRSPFLFSKSRNNFVFEGCGNALMMDHGNVIVGCSTTCRNDTISDNKNNCLGIGCCQTTVPYYLKSYIINLTSLGRQMGGAGACGSASLVDENSYNNRSLSSQSFISLGEDNFVPISLLWTLLLD